ncbi:MAG: metal-dependent hydrolase [bacterium]
MDSLTQFLMGSVVGQCVIGPKHKGKGALMGGLAGTLPDLDVLPFLGSSIVTQLTQHRGLSHSLLFTFIAPLLLAWLCRRYLSWALSFQRWFIFWFLAFFTHILLDLMTTWGTQILWPFPARFSLNSLFIIDPLITLPLLIGVLLSLWRRVYHPAAWGLCIASCYLCFSFGAHCYMSHFFARVFEHHSLSVRTYMVRPTPFNTLFWAVTARTNDDRLVFAYARLWDEHQDITLSSPMAQRSDLVSDFTQRSDVQQLLAITKGYYVIDKDAHSLTIQDARFGRFGGWRQGYSAPFIFHYVLDTNTFRWSQYRPPLPDSSRLFSSLFSRIFD